MQQTSCEQSFVFSASGREKTKLCSQRVCCMLYKVYHALTSAALCLYPCLSYNWNFQSLSTTFHYFFSASPLYFVYLCLYFLMFSNFDSSPASGPERGIRAPNGFGPRKGNTVCEHNRFVNLAQVPLRAFQGGSGLWNGDSGLERGKLGSQPVSGMLSFLQHFAVEGSSVHAKTGSSVHAKRGSFVHAKSSSLWTSSISFQPVHCLH
jgi:hypothetical protein